MKRLVCDLSAADNSSSGRLFTAHHNPPTDLATYYDAQPVMILLSTDRALRPQNILVPQPPLLLLFSLVLTTCYHDLAGSREECACGIGCIKALVPSLQLIFADDSG